MSTDLASGELPPSEPIHIDSTPLTLEQAAAQLWNERHKELEQAAQARAPDGKFAKAEPESAPPPQEQEAAPEEAPASGEDQSVEPEVEELPAIEPPRSWGQDDLQKWSSLPREAQEIIAARETARDSELSRTQRETAEQRKAFEAKAQAAEQERLRAEQAVTNAALIVQSELARDFPEVKTHEDAAKLAHDDPFRWAQWKQRMDNLQVLTFQAQQQHQQRQAAEAKAFQDWATEQDNKFSQGNKDFADPVKAEKNRELVVNYLTRNLGIAQDKLPELWNSRMFRQAEMQRAIWDAARFANAQEKAKAAVAAPKPPVQRPGTASRTSPAQNEIQALNAQLNKATSVQEQLRLSAAILAAERRAAKG